MDNKQRAIVDLRGTIAILILAGLSLAAAGCGEGMKSAAPMESNINASDMDSDVNAAQEEPAPNTPQLATIVIAFKLDLRLTRPLNLGDRWVAPPRFSPAVQEGDMCTVEAKAYAVDTSRNQITISPKWIPEDPARIKVVPDEGNQVTITVLGAGVSRLTVTGEGLSKTLTVKAEPYRETLKVAILQ